MRVQLLPLLRGPLTISLLSLYRVGIAIGTGWAVGEVLKGEVLAIALVLLGGLLNGYHMGREVERSLDRRRWEGFFRRVRHLNFDNRADPADSNASGPPPS